MTGTVLLQGGAEFSAGCRDMDAALVSRVPGRVVVTALAGAPGREYDTATRNGVRHYLSAGADDVVGAPDWRTDPEGALAAVRSARVLVLPGGSPSRLLGALQDSGIDRLLVELLADGGGVMGSSAGAMVLGSATVLPDRAGSPVVPALGVVDALVVPHWSGERGRGAWLAAAGGGAPGTPLLGLPEESGLLRADGTWTAVGRSATRLVDDGRDLAPGATWDPSAPGGAAS